MKSAESRAISSAKPIPITRTALRRWPLPPLPFHADKEVRGPVLVVAGSREMPGAAMLAAVAALQAGAGKLVIGAARSVAAGIAIAVPEARVIALPEKKSGSLAVRGLNLLESVAANASGGLIGPGMLDESATCAFALNLLPYFSRATVVLDACAMPVIERVAGHGHSLILTPHAGEMAHLLAISKDAVHASSIQTATGAARRWGAVVALKGANTVVAAPNGRSWRFTRGGVGLATSGSGDTLAGIVAGLAARGAEPSQAAVWGVALHGEVGAHLAKRGSVGFLAREIPAHVPAMLDMFTGSRNKRVPP